MTTPEDYTVCGLCDEDHSEHFTLYSNQAGIHEWMPPQPPSEEVKEIHGFLDFIEKAYGSDDWNRIIREEQV